MKQRDEEYSPKVLTTKRCNAFFYQKDFKTESDPEEESEEQKRAKDPYLRIQFFFFFWNNSVVHTHT